MAGDIDRSARSVRRDPAGARGEREQTLQMFIQSAKHLLVRAGAIAHATVREPVTAVDAQSLRELDTWSRLTNEALGHYASRVDAS